MARKKATKKAAGSKKATKGASAPAKKPAARPPKQASAKKAAAPTRKPLPRAAKKATTTAPPREDEPEGEEASGDEASPPPKRPAAKKSAKKPVKKPAKKPGKRKRPIPDSDSEVEAEVPPAEGPPAKRSRRSPRAPSPAEEASADQPNVNPEGEEEDELIDDAEASPDCDLRDADQLALAEFSNAAFRLRNDIPVRLRFRLQVYPDPEGSAARLFYRLRFWLTRTDQEDAEEAEAGYIHVHRIAKSTASHPHANNQDWLTFLHPNTSASSSETSICLRALFTQNGTPAVARVRDAAIRQSLVDESLMIIEMIHIRLPWQRNGLLQPLLERFDALLQRLPEWFAFRGNLVLVPGMPDNERGRRVWEQAGMDEERVDQLLRGVYERQGFVVWADGVNVDGLGITVMGRSVGDEENGDE